MVPPRSNRISRVPSYSRRKDCYYSYRAVTFFGSPFQEIPIEQTSHTGLVRVRSPLLTESRLMSFPPATEMFHFAGFTRFAYVFSKT